MTEQVLFSLPLERLEPIFKNWIKSAIKDMENQPAGTWNQSDANQLLNVKEAAKFLNLSVQTIYLMVSRGDIPVNKKNHRLYFLKSELTDWIKQGRKLTNDEIEKEAVNYLKTKK